MQSIMQSHNLLQQLYLNLCSPLNALRRAIVLFTLATAALWATPSAAQSAQPVFALAKNICAGNFAQVLSSGSGHNPANCPLATNVTANSDVYYVITITNPIGEPQQQINLIDALPQGFNQIGAIVCRDDATPTPNTIALAPGTGSNTIGSISLAPGATVHCFIQGKFANPSSGTNSTRLNTVNASNGGSAPFNMTASVSTNVLTTTPLLADLSVNKTSSSAINVSSGSGLITYTIVIKNNNASIDANVADYFKLNDNLSLPANGVPLNVEYVGSNCISTANTDCLALAGPNVLAQSPIFVGPYAPTNFFDWGFDAGKGMIKAQGVITLTVTISVSQVPGMGCTQSLNGNGLINQAFFTLANATGAYSELNSANNTSSVTTGVSTGQTTVDPNCGKGHMRIKKTQISPAPGKPVPWGTPVKYEITIENFSIPAQDIKVAAADFQDWITQGMNTPPFMRRHVATSCVASTDPALCAAFNPGIAPDPRYKYKFYGEKNRAWISNNGFTLASGNSVTFQTEFTYDDAECDTVPNAQPKPIINTARLRYSASVYGAPSNEPQDTIFDIEASAITPMVERPTCEFLVTKKFTKPISRIQFGVPFSYDITYSNLGLARTVGTLLDTVRLTIPNYASKLPYAATWSCTPGSGITGVTASGSISGNASYTTNPMQGAPAANLGSNVFFPSNSSLICTVQITLQRPAPNDPFCTQDKAEFENLALMDVTSPFNSNIAWPPSSTYNPANPSNPTPQNTSWAAVKAQLPACWDATVNKQATVDGLPPTSAPWTYVGGPGINYSITTTNKGQSNLGNLVAPPAQPQWLVEDTFNAPYANSNATAGSPICGPVGTPWCHSAAPMDPRSKIAIKTLAPQDSGVWNIKYTAPFLAGQPIKNCAGVQPDLGADAANFYQNSATSSQTPTACVTIPVVEVTEIKVKKSLVDNTGANVKTGGPFTMQVSGAPYPVPSTQTNFSLTTDITGMSPVHTIFPVARASTVTLNEVTAPIPAASALACGGAANVDVIKEYQDAQGVWKPMPAVLGNLNTLSVGNNITVRNTLKCKPAALQITKIVSGPNLPAQYAAINQNYTISASCNPAASPSNVILNAGAQSASGTLASVAGASCTISEAPPQLPQGIKDYCLSIGQTAAWDPLVISPINPMLVQPGTNAITVTNKWKCTPAAATMFHVMKILDAGPGGVQLSGLQFTVQATCNPSPATPTSATGTSGVSPNGNMIGILQVPSGSTCQFSEPAMPTFPSAAVTQCLPGSPKWNTPTFVTSPLVLKVTNSWSCTPSTGSTTTLVITKNVEGPSMPATVAQPPVTPAQNYQVTANCSKTGAPNLTSAALNAGGSTPASSTISVSVGDTCNITETPPSMLKALTDYCNQLYYGNNGKPYTAVWESPVFTPSASLPIVSGTNNVTVTNKWKCVAPTPTTATLTINKVVNKPANVGGNFPPNADVQSYQIGATCSSSPVAVIASGATNGSTTVSVTPGASCAISEATPSMPSNIAAYCVGKGTPTWKLPVITPASLTIANGSNVVTVTNSWECTPSTISTTAQLVITKKVEQIIVPGLTQPYSAPAQIYQATANCSSTPVSTVNLNASGSSPASGTVSVSTGATCNVTEAVPNMLPALTSFCNQLLQGNNGNPYIAVWESPIFTPASSITIATGTNNVTVTNKWKCVAPTPTAATLTINKVVNKPYYPGNSAPNADTQTYQINATCINGSVGVGANGSTSGKSTVNVTPGANCSFSEPTPTLPPNIVAFCVGKGTPTWKAPVFTPANLTVANGSNTVTVTNAWECATPPPTGVTLQVRKVVNGPPVTSIPVPVAPIQSFQINATCLSNPVSVNAGGSTVGGANVGNLTPAANCVFSEAAPTVNSTLNNYCATVGGTSVGTATWATPVFNPPNLVLATGVNTVTVTNTWGCVTAASTTGTVKFYKKVDRPTTPVGAPLLGSLNYSFSAVGATPASVAIAANAISAGYSPPLTAPINAQLNVTEALPSISGNALAQNFCGSGKTPTWNQPTFAKVITSVPYLEQPVTMPITVTAGETRIVVTNTWKCQ